jgi:hypothetical protein
MLGLRDARFAEFFDDGIHDVNTELRPKILFSAQNRAEINDDRPQSTLDNRPGMLYYLSRGNDNSVAQM